MNRYFQYADVVLSRYPISKEHGKDHIEKVLSHSTHYTNILPHRRQVLTLMFGCLYHDISLTVEGHNRKLHHIESQDMVHNDLGLKAIFSEEEIDVIGKCCLYHRSSEEMVEGIPLEAQIVHDVDGAFDFETLIETAINYKLKSHWKPLNLSYKEVEELIDEVEKHCKEKYGSGGYAKFYLPLPEFLKFKKDKLTAIVDSNMCRNLIIMTVHKTLSGAI